MGYRHKLLFLMFINFSKGAFKTLWGPGVRELFFWLVFNIIFHFYKNDHGSEREFGELWSFYCPKNAAFKFCSQM